MKKSTLRTVDTVSPFGRRHGNATDAGVNASGTVDRPGRIAGKIVEHAGFVEKQTVSDSGDIRIKGNFCRGFFSACTGFKAALCGGCLALAFSFPVLPAAGNPPCEKIQKTAADQPAENKTKDCAVYKNNDFWRKIMFSALLGFILGLQITLSCYAILIRSEDELR